MKRKQIKAALAAYNYKMIGPSWHKSEKHKNILFIAYDEWGMCYQFYINMKHKMAIRTMMTDADIQLEPIDAAYMFFEEV